MRNVKRTALVSMLAALLLLAVVGAASAATGTMMGTSGTTDATHMGTTDTHMGTTDTTHMGTTDTTHMGTTDTSHMGTIDGTHMGMFPDTGGQWYEDMAEHMAQAGFMNGYADGHFGGTDPINRAQFAAIMARMMGISPVGTSHFGDMDGTWAEGAVAAMTRDGIIQGRPDGTFGPYEPITRAQMATMMYRARTHLGLSCPGMSTTELNQRLHDVAGHWAMDSIDHMYRLGVVQGDAAGYFHPDSHTNRAQAAAMLWRWHEAQ